MGAGSSNGTKKSRPQQGDDVSRKQLQRTVLDGCRVTMHVAGVEPITGYVAGMDSYHWMLVTPEGEKHLIHKSAAALVRLHDEPTYDQEPQRSLLEQIIAPFRDFIMRQRHGPPAKESARK